MSTSRKRWPFIGTLLSDFSLFFTPSCLKLLSWIALFLKTGHLGVPKPYLGTTGQVTKTRDCPVQNGTFGRPKAALGDNRTGYQKTGLSCSERDIWASQTRAWGQQDRSPKDGTVLFKTGHLGDPKPPLGTTGQVTKRRDCPVQYGTCGHIRHNTNSPRSQKVKQHRCSELDVLDCPVRALNPIDPNGNFFNIEFHIDSTPSVDNKGNNQNTSA
ncbi:hypothetical protein AVEN_98174-1 [Araneus ventricosus]|uniref:Uncharacterized protein n=1 Tax=Araneus ventricosus TaxID=182803 RepID=A0A4Y2SZK7_ARAVE|nr:hypothetical protein AVEN_98174-1 [Araneus ventricosus]